jgi:hypothetical protein
MRPEAGAGTVRAASREGPKHDLWVVPYADMMTLLFAVFVVLYAIGEVRLQKLEELRRSLSNAFRVGSGGHADAGAYDLGPVATGGELLDGFELITAQPGPMKQFLLEALPGEFREVTGRSLEIVMADDTVAFEAPLAAFYEAGADLPRAEVRRWLVGMFENAFGFAATVRIRIEAPDVVVGRDADGTARRSEVPCERRLAGLRQVLRRIPQVETRQVTTEFRALPPVVDPGTWEQAGRIVFAFSTP